MLDDRPVKKQKAQPKRLLHTTLRNRWRQRSFVDIGG
jgi:hypothetical protein